MSVKVCFVCGSRTGYCLGGASIEKNSQLVWLCKNCVPHFPTFKKEIEEDMIEKYDLKEHLNSNSF